MHEKEQEAQRQIEANRTALAALGPRKKRKYGEEDGFTHTVMCIVITSYSLTVTVSL